MPGTVSGRIFGLVDDEANQAATSIVIDAFPAALDGVLDEGADAVLWDMVVSNSFDVSNGVVTQFNLFAQTAGPDGEGDFLCLANEANDCSGSDNVAALGLSSPNQNYVRSFQPGAVTFTVSPVQ